MLRKILVRASCLQSRMSSILSATLILIRLILLTRGSLLLNIMCYSKKILLYEKIKGRLFMSDLVQRQNIML